MGTRAIPELLVTGDPAALERATVTRQKWSRRVDGRSTRQPRTISAEAIAEARTLRSK